MIETIILIVIIALAAAYVARNFYRKFGGGKSQNSDCSCSGCDCGTQENCQPESTTDCKAGGMDIRPKAE